MKKIYLYIIAALAMMIGACTAAEDEPVLPVGPDGELPMAFRTVGTGMSRDEDYTVSPYIKLYDVDYKMYCGAIAYGPKSMNQIWTLAGLKSDTFFLPMKYRANSSDRMLITDGRYYPPTGRIAIYSFGVECTSPGCEDNPIYRGLKPLLTVKQDPNKKVRILPDYMELDLTAKDNVTNQYYYNGTFDIIVADTMDMECTRKLKESKEADMLPWAKYHHLMSHISVKVKWADGVSATSPIIDRITINSVRIADTPCRGIMRMTDKVANATWIEPQEKQDEVLLPNTAADKVLHYTTTFDLGGSYIVPQKQRRSFVVNYTLKNGPDTQGNYTYRTMNYVVAAPDPEIDGVTKGWLAGHKYTYTITIGAFGEAQVSKVEVKKYEDKTFTTEIY